MIGMKLPNMTFHMCNIFEPLVCEVDQCYHLIWTESKGSKIAHLEAMLV